MRIERSILDARGKTVPVARRAIGRRDAPPVGPVYEVVTPPGRKIEELTGRIRRLGFSSREPERFHLERDDICNELMKLSRSLAPARSVQSGASR